jgi:hypothetical protein
LLTPVLHHGHKNDSIKSQDTSVNYSKTTKAKNYDTLWTIPKCNENFVETGQNDILHTYTNVHNKSLSWLATGTSIKEIAGV